MSPATPQELADLVRDAERVPVPLFGGEGLSFAAMNGEIRHDVADGVVSCLSGTTLGELNAVLARDGRWVPYVPVWPGDDLPLAALMLLGLPHAAEGAYGSWRDWLLGSTMATAEGALVKSGSRVVKSVAGYDAHKLILGSRGTLVLPAEVVFRTFPTPPHSYPQPVQRLVEKVGSILRVKAADIRPCLQSLENDVLWADERTATVWTSRSVQDLPPFPYAWSMDPYCPTIPALLLPLHRRTKAVLDPGGKLAPGAFHNL